MLTNKDLSTIKQLLDLAENNICQAKDLLFSRELSQKVDELGNEDKDSKIIEGVFDGEGMIGSDKRH